MKLAVYVALLTVIGLSPLVADDTAPSPTAVEESTELDRIEAFLHGHQTRLAPLEREARLAWWLAATTGSRGAQERESKLQAQLDAVYSDPAAFAMLRRVRGKGAVTDPLQRRQLDRIYLAFLPHQADPALRRITAEREAAVERAFASFRPRLAGREITDNEIDEVLATSSEREVRKAYWLASRRVGALLAPHVLEVVRLRNEVARSLGFRDFYALQLTLLEQNERWLLALFDGLDQLTADRFAAEKAAMDAQIAARLGVPPASLMPWDYHDRFFQQAPSVARPEIDRTLAGADVVALATALLTGIDLDPRPILARSDLYERPGKSPHAFSADLDREGDVRALLNVRPTLRWLETTVHELTHGVFSLNVRRSLPYVLRTEAHIFVSEGVAMLLGALVNEPDVLHRMGLIDEATAARLRPEMQRQRRLQSLVFSRWCQVMLRFEKELYADPDQDLDEVWWRLVKRYQGLRRPPEAPAGAWASKIHVVSAPGYYHNYQLGELYAAQLHRALCRDLFPGRAPDAVVWAGDPRVGAYLREKVFAPGASRPWPEFVRQSTGKALSADAYAAQQGAVGDDVKR